MSDWEETKERLLASPSIKEEYIKQLENSNGVLYKQIIDARKILGYEVNECPDCAVKDCEIAILQRKLDIAVEALRNISGGFDNWHGSFENYAEATLEEINRIASQNNESTTLQNPPQSVRYPLDGEA